MSNKPRRPEKPSYGNDPYDCIELEDMQPDTWYAFTVNPADRKQYFDHGTLLFQKDNTIMDYPTSIASRIQNQINETSKQLNKMYNIQYDLKMEISHKGRIHWHGYIKVKDIYAFYLADVVRLQELFTYSIKEIRDPEKWHEYINKQKPKYRIRSIHPITKEKSPFYDLRLEVQKYDPFLDYDEKQVVRNMLRINEYEHELNDYWEEIYDEYIEKPKREKYEEREFYRLMNSIPNIKYGHE